MDVPVIDANQLGKVYATGESSVVALADVTLHVDKGEFVAVVGASGSGKSTFMNLVGLLDRPTGGSLRLDGVDVAQLTPNQRAAVRNRKVGFVFQGFNLLRRTSALENVELPLLYAGVAASERARLARQALTQVGLGDRLGHMPNQLSGGQQQRVAIARAMAMAPEIMLFDEVTSALDPELVGEVLDVMKQLASDGTTMIVVTHEMSFAQDVADRVVVMDAGQVVEQGLADEVLMNPKNARTAAFLSRFHGTREKK